MQKESQKFIPTEIYSRVCGYYRPLNQANTGKQEEISQRKLYDANKKFVEYLNK